MPKKLRHPFESPTHRRSLTPQGRPYRGPKLMRGVQLNYRRNGTANTNGSWVGKIANGHGSHSEPKIGEADDFGKADGVNVLSFEQAENKLKKMVSGGTEVAVLTLATAALKSYEDDLIARGARPNNVSVLRFHLTGSSLLTMPLALITVDELKLWRNGMVAKGLKPASVNRVRNSLRACLELALPARSHVWKEGLETLPNAQRARAGLIFTDDRIISELVAEAYRRDPALGLLCDVCAVTGTRPVQAQRLRVEDLIADPKRPRLLMNKSAKGGGRNRASKKTQLYPLPITPALAAKLQEAAKDRADDAPLLLRSDGEPWNADSPSGDYRHRFADVVEVVGLPASATMYLFRHSSIARRLLQGMQISVVASLHDTSEAMIRAHYGKFIIEDDAVDDIIRKGLLHHDEPAPDNVIPLAR